MDDSHDDTRLWPTSPFFLADAHRCPSCFTVISAPVCTACGFALTDPRSARVLELGREIVSAELSRQELLDTIRLTAVSLAPAAAPAAPVVPVAVPGPASAPAAASAPPIPEAPEDALAGLLSSAADDAAPAAREPRGPVAAPPAGVTASAPRRRLTVPVLLLIVGVSLVGVAAVYFLLLAWFVAGIEARALIIGGITLATIALASWLRRRSLTATAEGIGALGVVLLALDAWAVRANDLFGAGAGDPAVYAGLAALVVAVVCRLWARFSHLRGPDLAASLALPAGLGLLVGGLADLPAAEAVTAGLLGAAAGGLVHALPAPWSSARRGADGMPERMVLALCGVAALAASGLTSAFLTGDAVPVVVWSSVGLLVLGAVHAWLAVRPVGGALLPASRVVSGAASAIAATAAGLAGWQLALRTELPVYAVLVAPTLAVLVALAVDVVRTRRGTRFLLPAAIVAAVIAAVSVIGVTLAWAMQAVAAIAEWTAWRTDAVALPTAAPEAPFLAVATAVVIAAAVLVAPTLRRPVLRDLAPVVAAIVLLVAAARTAVPLVIVGVGVALTVVAVAVVAVLRRRSSSPASSDVSSGPASSDVSRSARADRGSRPPAVREAAAAPRSLTGWLIAGGLAAATAYAGGVAMPWLWLVGVALAIAYPIVLRLVLRPTAEAAVAVVLAPVAVAALSTLLAPAALAAATGLSGAEGPMIAVLVFWVALATLAAAIALRLEPASRTALALAAEALVVIGIVGTASTVTIGGLRSVDDPLVTALGEPVLGIVRGALLLAGLIVVALGRTRITGIAVVVAAALTAPIATVLTLDVLRTFDAEGADAAPLLLTATAVAVPVVCAIAVLSRRSARPAAEASELVDPATTPVFGRALRRTAADVGAALTVLVVAWGVDPTLAWITLGIVAIGFGAASVTRGWAAPAGDADDDRFATRRSGMPLAAAPRRLLAWPAIAAAIAAWWSWLGDGTPAIEYTVESYVVPAAVVLTAFAALLVHLRRRAEASIALAAGLVLGLVVPAIEGWSGDPLRGVIVGIVAAAVCLALAFTPVRGILPVAPVGASVAMAALGLVAVERAGDGPAWQVLWLVLLVAVAYASGAGMTLARSPRARPTGLSARWYAVVVPAAALVAAIVAIVPLADEPRIVAGALIMLGALHLGAAGLDRLPLTAPTRWISLAGAAGVGAAAWFFGAAGEIEAVSLPVAAVCLAGAALAMLRRRAMGRPWPAAEGGAWIAGLVLATAPSLLAQVEPVRVWASVTLTLAAAAGVAVVREPVRVTRPASVAGEGFSAAITPTAQGPQSMPPAAVPPAAAPRAPLFRDVWTLRAPTAMILGLAALVIAAQGLVPPGFAGDTAAAIVAAVGALAVAVLFTATAATDRTARVATILAGGGAALLLFVSLTHPDADLVTTTIAAVTGGVAGVAGASVLGLRRWAPLGGMLAVGGLVAALAACGTRFLVIASDTGLEPDLWAVAAAGIAAAIALAALRATSSPAIGRAAGVGFAIASVVFAAAELQLLVLHETGEGMRTAVVMSALTVAVVAGLATRARLGLSFAITAAAAGAVFGVVALSAVGVRPVELVTIPPALGGIAYGARVLRRNPASRTWPTLGPWLALLTVPSLIHDFGGSERWLSGSAAWFDAQDLWFGTPDLWRVVGLGLVTIAMVAIGAVYRLQAPLVLGSAVLLVHATAQLWPWISSAYVAVPWWLWLGLGGALLIFIAARYEKRVRALRAAFLTVASLR